MSDDKGLNMKELLAKAQEIQKSLKQKQEEAANQKIKVSVGGGMINVVMNGKFEVKSIRIAKEVVDPEDIESLEDLLRSAMNEAIRRTQKESKADMSKLLGGVKIPGFEFP